MGGAHTDMRREFRGVDGFGVRVRVDKRGRQWWVDVMQTGKRLYPLEYSMTSGHGQKVSLRYSGKAAKP